ncbi:2',3'-cyclic-nucleotide 3'-phosphodiesterase [Antennarius striatus]|uniref:2',3'-cyclic-nucleotide 3'-phosphodiesterase n=1 Tax=Antennarius striatus TaxID=241820 RepID=UPI0035B3FF00
MDTERSSEVLDASDSPQQEDKVMEKEAVSELEIPEEFTEPVKPPAVEEETEHVVLQVQSVDVTDLKETEDTAKVALTVSEKKEGMENEDVLPAEKSVMESIPDVVAPPEPDESSENISDPIAALDTEAENVQSEQQHVIQNEPEPLTVQSPLAESVPETMPEKLAESVPEAELQEQTLPEPTVQQPADTQPPGREKESEQVVTEAELPTAMSTGAEEITEKEVTENVAAEPPVEGGEGKQLDKENLGDLVSLEKTAEAEQLKEEAAAAGEKVQPADDNKEVEPEKSNESDAVKEAEGAAECQVAESENNAELEKEVDTTPASGSLSFAILEQEQTKDALRTSRTLIILRGLPGSGKSFLAAAITDSFKDQCAVICADDHGVKPEDPESSVDGYKALDEAVVARCSAGAASSLLLVVDDTNHTQDRLARLGEIAEQQRLVAIFLEPCTEWSRDAAQLTKKTKRGLGEAQLEAMKGQLEEMSLPLYFGWFLLSSVQDKVRCTSMDFLKTLDTLEAFKKHLTDFTGKAEKEVDLEQYFKAKGSLHCTTKFLDYGKAEGAKEYAQNPAVKSAYGSVSELSLIALFVTPRTVGARVSLTEEQLLLWPADAETSVQPTVSLPLGSRAHVTLGCADGVEPVQTGLDLLEILALQQEGQQGELVEEMGLGSLAYYGEGRWLLSLREPICAPACFSSFYGHKETEPAKKDPAKKKKQKCNIL